MNDDLKEAVKELIDFLEENNVCDESHINWITDEDGFIESNRSAEMQELINKISELIED